MRKLLIAGIAGMALGAAAFPALASGSNGAIQARVQVTGADDVGTCNNVWAEDSYKKFYNLTYVSPGTYHLQILYQQGRFVSNAGMSPGACETGSYDGGTIAGGVTGNMHQDWENTVTATSAPSRNPDCSANNGCVKASNFLDAVFGSGNWSVGDWSYTGHYEAGSNGTWFDTWANWPLNDRGDITGS